MARCRPSLRASAIVTSNRPFSRWGDVFGDVTVAAAIIDRLLHDAEVISLKGDSYPTQGPRPRGNAGKLLELFEAAGAVAGELSRLRERLLGVLNDPGQRTVTIPLRKVAAILQSG